jgi:hypothetical protein
LDDWWLDAPFQLVDLPSTTIPVMTIVKASCLLVTTSIVSLLVLMAAGCKPDESGSGNAPAENPVAAPSPPSSGLGLAGSHYTAFFVGEGTVGAGTADAFYNFGIQLMGQGCTIWTDVGPWKHGEQSPRTASAYYPLPDGQQLSWKCQTPDERSFTSIEICGRDYLLKDGGLFLISTRAKQPQVVQLKMPGVRVLELEPFAAQFPEVAQFLARKQITPPAR